LLSKNTFKKSLDNEEWKNNKPTDEKQMKQVQGLLQHSCETASRSAGKETQIESASPPPPGPMREQI
jgi:hypothetical protein